MKKKYLTFLLFLIVHTVVAQGELDDEVRSFYRDENTTALVLNTNGFALNFRHGKKQDGYRKKIYAFDLAIIKHPKEIKTSYTTVANVPTGRYVYGKENIVFGLKGGVGKQKEMFMKYDKGGVAIRYFYTYGPAVALLKPIYYSVYENPGVWNDPAVDRKFDYAKHQPQDIAGKSSFIKGFNEIKASPGAYAQFGFSFEFSKTDELIRAIETGVMAEGYLLDVPIMAEANNPRLFVVLWLSFRFGRLIKPAYLKK